MMPLQEIRKQHWWVSRPFEGRLEVINAEDGKVVCTVDISDFESPKAAKQIATLIARSPELFDLCCWDILEELYTLEAKAERQR